MNIMAHRRSKVLIKKKFSRTEEEKKLCQSHLVNPETLEKLLAHSKVQTPLRVRPQKLVNAKKENHRITKKA